MSITQARLKELLHYDPLTGVFRWRVTRRVAAGAIAGSVTEHGYRRIRVDGCHHYAQRLAWLYVHGVWRTEAVDHRDGDRDNNRIANLREATRSQNNANSRTRSKVGFKGVSRSARSKTFHAQITVGGRPRYLGSYKTPQEAHAAYVRAAREHFGEFARPE